MAPVPVLLYAGAAAVAVFLAGLVLGGHARRSEHRFLALALVAVAVEFAFQAVQIAATHPNLRGVGHRASLAAETMTPVFLYAFAATYRAPNSLSRPRWVLTVFGIGAVLTLAVPFTGDSIDVTTANWIAVRWAAMALFEGGVLLIVFGYFLRALLSESAEPGHRLLFPAVAFATLPLIHRVGGGLTYVATELFALPYTLWTEVAFVYFPLVALPLGVSILARRSRTAGPRTRALAVGATAAGVTLALFFHTLTFLRGSALHVAGHVVGGPTLHALGEMTRWLGFACAASIAVLRHDLLGMSLRSRRRAAKLLVAAGFAAFALLALAIFRVASGGLFLDLRAIDLAFLAFALVISQRFHRLVEVVAERVYGVPMRGDRARALDAYRAALERAIRDGREPGSDAELTRLREELGVDAREGAVLERMAASLSEGSAPIAEGRLVAGRYRVARLIGRGGGGRAFLARDELIERDVVLKEVADARTGGHAALAEARAAGRIQHPNVLTLHDVIARQGALVLVTEYLPGGSLAERLSQGGPLPIGEGVRMIAGVLRGLGVVHASGIIHRDLKPANVFIAPDGTPKIGDFGVAHVRGSATAHPGEADVFVGTPDFMAPEQRRGDRATPASDLYAVGLLARRSLRHPLPERVEAVVARALEEAPEARWKSAEAMRQALTAASEAPLFAGAEPPVGG